MENTGVWLTLGKWCKSQYTLSLSISALIIWVSLLNCISFEEEEKKHLDIHSKITCIIYILALEKHTVILYQASLYKRCILKLTNLNPHYFNDFNLFSNKAFFHKSDTIICQDMRTLYLFILFIYLL